MANQYNISALEQRRDWPVIVMSTECTEPGCGAKAGEHCWQATSSLGVLGQKSQRQDFHAVRKYAAAQYLEQHPLPDQQEPPRKEGAARPESVVSGATERPLTEEEMESTPRMTGPLAVAMERSKRKKKANTDA